MTMLLQEHETTYSLATASRTKGTTRPTTAGRLIGDKASRVLVPQNNNMNNVSDNFSGNLSVSGYQFI